MIVMATLPVLLLEGAMVTVRLEPLPPKVMAAWATSAGTEDVALSRRADAFVSASPMVKGRGPTAIPATVL